MDWVFRSRGGAQLAFKGVAKGCAQLAARSEGARS